MGCFELSADAPEQSFSLGVEVAGCWRWRKRSHTLVLKPYRSPAPKASAHSPSFAWPAVELQRPLSPHSCSWGLLRSSWTHLVGNNFPFWPLTFDCFYDFPPSLFPLPKSSLSPHLFPLHLSVCIPDLPYSFPLFLSPFSPSSLSSHHEAVNLLFFLKLKGSSVVKQIVVCKYISAAFPPL